MASINGAPVVSAIVPAFNSGLYIGDALTSLERQTLDDIEIVVIDDGSTDDTAQIVDAHARRDPRVRVIHRDVASGRPACARNDGLRAARGEYIALLDADDVATPDRLNSALEAMRQAGAGFAFADYRKIYQEGGTAEQRDVLETVQFRDRAAGYLTHVADNVFLCSPSFPAFLLTCIAVNTPTVVFKRDLLDNEPQWFDESLVCFEDVDLWFRLAEHTRFVFVNETHALNRRHAASLTASHPMTTKLDGIAVRKAHLKRLWPSLSAAEIAAARQTIADLSWDVGYSNWCDGQCRAARAGFRESWRAVPSMRALRGYIKAFMPRDRAITMHDAITTMPPPASAELRERRGLSS